MKRGVTPNQNSKQQVGKNSTSSNNNQTTDPKLSEFYQSNLALDVPIDTSSHENTISKQAQRISSQPLKKQNANKVEDCADIVNFVDASHGETIPIIPKDLTIQNSDQNHQRKASSNLKLNDEPPFLLPSGQKILKAHGKGVNNQLTNTGSKPQFAMINVDFKPRPRTARQITPFSVSCKNLMRTKTCVSNTAVTCTSLLRQPKLKNPSFTPTTPDLIMRLSEVRKPVLRQTVDPNPTRYSQKVVTFQNLLARQQVNNNFINHDRSSQQMVRLQTANQLFKYEVNENQIEQQQQHKILRPYQLDQSKLKYLENLHSAKKVFGSTCGRRGKAFGGDRFGGTGLGVGGVAFDKTTKRDMSSAYNKTQMFENIAQQNANQDMMKIFHYDKVPREKPYVFRLYKKSKQVPKAEQEQTQK